MCIRDRHKDVAQDAYKPGAQAHADKVQNEKQNSGSHRAHSQGHEGLSHGKGWAEVNAAHNRYYAQACDGCTDTVIEIGDKLEWNHDDRSDAWNPKIPALVAGAVGQLVRQIATKAGAYGANACDLG